MKSVVIVYAKRSAIGKLNGALASLSAPQLGSKLVADAIGSLRLDPASVDEIIMGQVLQAGSGQAPARQTAIAGGLTYTTPATTINKVCGSGMKSLMLGAQSIMMGQANVVFAGGQESMSQAPHMLMNSRKGYKMGSVTMLDHMMFDGLTNPYDGQSMGICGDLCAQEKGISREEQDQFAIASYQRARATKERGGFAREIVPIEVKEGKTTVMVEHDEEPFSVSLEKLPALSPAFQKDGSVTAGNASSINDGAAMLVLMEEGYAKQNGFKPLARLKNFGTHAQKPAWFTTAPVIGIRKLLSQSHLYVKDIDLFEVNEAFSVVPLVAMHEHKISHDRMNIRGGAVALGHPIGASGARIVVTLIDSLHEAQKSLGVASICIGGGEACSLLVEAL